MKNQLLTLAFLCSALSGCATASIGKNFDSGKVKELKICESNKASVHTALGDPLSEGFQDGMNTDVYDYEYSTVVFFKGWGGRQSFVAAYDKDSKLVDMALNASSGYTVKNRCATTVGM